MSESEDDVTLKRGKKTSEMRVHDCKVQITWDDHPHHLDSDEESFDFSRDWYSSYEEEGRDSSPEPYEFDPYAEIRDNEEKERQFYPLRGERADELLNALHHVIPVEEFRLATLEPKRQTRNANKLNYWRDEVKRIRRKLFYSKTGSQRSSRGPMKRPNVPVPIKEPLAKRASLPMAPDGYNNFEDGLEAPMTQMNPEDTTLKPDHQNDSFYNPESDQFLFDKR
ncbi:hypothetical protein L596_030143 [Steinernema carpocapsae]|nr:hypothetical protein L596_030143 [Steinernema carpocapsae]